MPAPTDPTLPRVIARRYQPHLPGFVYVLLTALLVLGAVNSQNNLLFAIFGLAVAGIIVSGVVSGAAIMGLRIEREIVQDVEAGGDASVRYHVHNANWIIPSAGLVIEELESDRKGRHKASWPRHTGAITAFVPWIRAGERLVIEGRGRTHTRGTATLKLIRITTTFPFGLTRKYVLFLQESHILITPWFAPVERGAISQAFGGWEGRLARKATRALEGEFFAIRDYAQGDSPRAIAWRASARRGQLVVRETTENERRRVMIEVDPANAAGDALEQFIASAAGLCGTLIELGTEVELRVGDAVVGAGTGPRQRLRIARALAQIPDSLDSSVAFAPGNAKVILRSPDGDASKILTAEELAALCHNWSGFPARTKTTTKAQTRPLQVLSRLMNRRPTTQGGGS